MRKETFSLSYGKIETDIQCQFSVSHWGNREFNSVSRSILLNLFLYTKFNNLLAFQITWWKVKVKLLKYLMDDSSNRTFKI